MSTVCHPEVGKVVTVTFPLRSPSTTACRSRSARRGGATARAWWRSPTTRRAALVAHCRTTPPSRKPKPRSTGSVSEVMPGCVPPPLTRRPACSPSPNKNHSHRCPRRVPRHDQRGTDRVRPGAGRLARNFLLRPTRLARARVVAWQRLGAQHLDIATSSGIADRPPSARTRRRRVMVRDHGHVIAGLSSLSWPATTPAVRTAARSASRGPAARAAADALAGPPTTPDPVSAVNDDVVIDLAKYDRAANGRNTPHDHPGSAPTPPARADDRRPGQPLPAAACLAALKPPWRPSTSPACWPKQK